MIENKFLILTLQILVSFTDCQRLPKQPWSHQNVEQGFTELVKQCHCVHQPLTIQTQIQSIPVAPKATAPQCYLAPLNWEKAVTNPTTNNLNNYDPNIFSTDCYENKLRKYESMNKPNPVVNNYYTAPPQYNKRTESDRRNRKQRPDAKKKKSGKKRQKKENFPSSNNDGKQNMNKQHSEYKSKNINNELTEVNKNGERKRRRKNTNKTHANDLEIERNLDPVKQNDNKMKIIIDKETQNLNDKEKLLNFGENPTTESILKARPQYFNEEHRHTRNSKPAIEYQTKYIDPQEEYNKYLQNFMNGNLSTDPYYFMNFPYPYNFDSFYKTPQKGKSTKPKNKGSNKRKNSQSKTINDRKDEENNDCECNTVIELTPTVYKSSPKSISTGNNPNSKDIIINVKIQKNDQSSDVPKDLNSESTPKQEQDYIESKNEDNNKIHKAPLTITLYEPLMDEDLEYYPDFTLLNGAYLTSSEEEQLYELQNNNFDNMDQWDYYADKVKSYVENCNKKKPNIFTGSNTDLNKKVNEKQKNVETVYAPSKVVIYNQPDKKSQDSREGELSNYTFKEGDTTIVLSRRVD